jgi:hypothetical protein
VTLAKLPDPKFVGWFRWAALRDGSLDRDTTNALQEVGTYLLAHFGDKPPPSVDRSDVNIFYVGETHGRSRSLRARLMDFGKSAGFLGTQRNGTYAAWDFPEFARSKNIDVSEVYVAVCPYVPGTNSAHDARGLFPTLVESIILWSYTHRHGCMLTSQPLSWKASHSKQTQTIWCTRCAKPPQRFPS